MTASNGPQSDEAGVYRGRLDAPSSLQRCENGLPATFRDNIDTGCLSAGGGVAAFGTTDGSVYVTPTRASRGQPSPATSHPSSASRCADPPTNLRQETSFYEAN